MKRKLSDEDKCAVQQCRAGGSRHLEAVKDQSRQGIYIAYGRRFCESCQASKPKGARKAIKGWQCDDCRSAAA